MKTQSITEMHVMLAEDTPTPLEDVMQLGETRLWRVNIEDVRDLKYIFIWDKENCRKLKARVTNIVEEKGGKVIQFNPETAKLYNVRWENRPKFNRIGIALL